MYQKIAGDALRQHLQLGGGGDRGTAARGLHRVDREQAGGKGLGIPPPARRPPGTVSRSAGGRSAALQRVLDLLLNGAPQLLHDRHRTPAGRGGSTHAGRWPAHPLDGPSPRARLPPGRGLGDIILVDAIIFASCVVGGSSAVAPLREPNRFANLNLKPFKPPRPPGSPRGPLSPHLKKRRVACNAAEVDFLPFRPVLVAPLLDQPGRQLALPVDRLEAAEAAQAHDLFDQHPDPELGEAAAEQHDRDCGEACASGHPR